MGPISGLIYMIFGFFRCIAKIIFYSILFPMLVLNFFIPFIFLPPLFIMYLLWIWFIDTDTLKSGGRRFEFVRSMGIWKYAADYFPIKLVKESDFQLDSTKNYLFCAFPHGIISLGVVLSFATTGPGINELFPNHKPYLLTLKQILKIPFLRDLFLALGLCSASENSINYILRREDGGNIATLVVGGAAETMHSHPGQYRLVLKNRKGFAKMALKNGSPLVPVFSFGELEILDQLAIGDDALLKKFQMWFKQVTGLPFIFPIGRNYFRLPMILKRTPINVVVGRPIEVGKVEDPTEEQVDGLHKLFIENLTKLFEENKHKYIKNANNKSLIIV